MDKKLLKDLVILVGIIIIAAIGARILAGGETLSDYAKKNPEKAGVSSLQEASIDNSKKDVSTVQLEKNDVRQTGAGSDATSVTDKNPSGSVDSSDASSTSTTETNASAIDSASVAEASEESEIPEKAEATEAADEAVVSSSESSPERITYKEGFYYEPIPNDVFKRISGISYPVDCTVPLSDLRYVVLQYVDFNDDSKTGELICNKDLAQDLVEIFYELYSSGYQIESVKLIDEFGGDDEASMQANNSSCFNYRVIAGTTRLSNHAKGRAIDINPFYNPYVTYKDDGTVNISPKGSEAYADRDAQFPYKIDENDLAYKLFKAHGFKWGGDWNSVKDFQHFEKK